MPNLLVQVLPIIVLAIVCNGCISGMLIVLYFRFVYEKKIVFFGQKVHLKKFEKNSKKFEKITIFYFF